MKNIFCFLCFVFICSFCWADSVTFTSQADWEAGSLNAIQTKMSPGDLILSIPNPIPAEIVDGNTAILAPLDAQTNTDTVQYLGNCPTGDTCSSCTNIWNSFGAVQSIAPYKSLSGQFPSFVSYCGISSFAQGTIQFWINPTSSITSGSGSVPIISYACTSWVTFGGWNRLTNDGTIQFSDGTNTIATVGKTNWISGQWYHIFLSWKPSLAKLWVNRELVQTSSASFSFLSCGSGYSLNLGGPQFSMDDVKISTVYKDILGPFASSGSWQSQVQVFNSVAISPVVISWNADVPASTSLQLQARISSDGINFTSWFTVVQGQKITSDPTQKYIQVQALFSTSDSTLTPNLHDITLANSPTNQPPINQAIVYPNPFRYQAGQPTQLAVNLNYPAEVKIKIYDSNENVVYSSDNQGGLGNNLYTWTPQGISNGVYFVQFTVNDQQIVKKLVIIK